MLIGLKSKEQTQYARKLKKDLFKSKITLIKRLIAGGFDSEALSEIQRVQEMRDLGGNHYIKVAECYCLMERFKDALEVLSSIENSITLLENLSKKHNLARLNLMGLTYKHLKEEKKSVDKWRIGLQIDPYCNVILNNMGNYYNHKGEYGEAARYYWKCKKCNLALT